MTSFKTSFGTTIHEVTGYLEAHPHFDLTDVSPPYEDRTYFGIDGFIKDVYEYSIMIDFLESLGFRCAWERALDVGGAEGTMSRLLRGEGRAQWTATLDLTDLGKCLSTATCLRHWARFRLATTAARFSPKLRRFLLGDGMWRGKRLTWLYPNFGYQPPRSSTFWNLRLRAIPSISQYIVGDFYKVEEKFDLITSFLALPCFDAERFFSKSSALLDEGGTLFFICDNWWFPVNSAVLVGRFPYVAQRLTESDFRRYVEEFHPDCVEDWMARYRYFHEGKQRPTLNGYIEIADRYDLELIGSRMLYPPYSKHNRAAVPPRVLNQFEDTRLSAVLEDIRRFRPDVGMVDLMTNYVMAAFVKRRRTTPTLSQYLQNKSRTT